MSFLTIASPAEAEFVEKKSKFLAYAYPMKNESELKSLLEEIKRLHPAARHICYAFRLGEKKDIWKVYDAGEPANTAGQPILGQIKSFDLSNVAVIVVRYFGGIKLGVGGLMSAYKEAAYEVLTASSIIEDFEKEVIVFEVPFAHVEKARYLLRKEGVSDIKEDFSEKCTFTVMVSRENLSNFVMKLNALPDKKLLTP